MSKEYRRIAEFIVMIVLLTVLGIAQNEYALLAAFWCGVAVTLRYCVLITPVKTSRYHRLKRNGGRHTDQQWRMLLRRYNYRCAACQRNDVPLTRDHIVPVSKGGSDNISNLQPLCTSCNSRKGTQIIRY